jgi:ribosome biogenesis protein ENP2
MKVFELKELSMKFERHMVSEIVDFEVLISVFRNLSVHKICLDTSKLGQEGVLFICL